MTTHRRERAALLAARRDALKALAQVQRGSLALRLRGLEPPLRWAERGWRFWWFAQAHVWTLWLPLAGLLVLPSALGRVAWRRRHGVDACRALAALNHPSRTLAGQRIAAVCLA